MSGNGTYNGVSSSVFNNNQNAGDYTFANSLNTKYELPATSVGSTTPTMQDKLVESQIALNDRLGLAPTTYGGLTVGDWMGAGGLALQGYNTFFGPQKELAEKQMQGIDANIKLANQQVKSNKQAMADRKQFNTTWANASNGLVPRTV